MLSVALVLSACASPVIVFSSDRTGQGDIYLRAGDRDLLLAENDRPDRFPRCSANGRQIVFVRGRGTDADIVLVDRRTDTERTLTHDKVADGSPTWSPDGRSIYFTRREGKFDRIARIPVAGGRIDYVTDGAAHDTMPSLSPSGRMLVHHTYRYGRETELHLIDLTTGASRRITDSAGSDYEASFAGNGTILFSSNRAGGHYRIYRLDLASGTTRLLADAGSDAWGPRFDPVKKRVLFFASREGRSRLMTVGLGGGPITALASDGAENSGGDWCRS